MQTITQHRQSLKRRARLSVFALCAATLLAGAGLKAAGALQITAAIPDTDALTLDIYGNYFGAVQGTVKLNGFPLAVVSWADQHITATLPPEVPAGTYLLLAAIARSAVWGRHERPL